MLRVSTKDGEILIAIGPTYTCEYVCVCVCDFTNEPSRNLENMERYEYYEINNV